MRNILVQLQLRAPGDRDRLRSTLARASRARAFAILCRAHKHWHRITATTLIHTTHTATLAAAPPQPPLSSRSPLADPSHSAGAALRSQTWAGGGEGRRKRSVRTAATEAAVAGAAVATAVACTQRCVTLRVDQQRGMDRAEPHSGAKLEGDRLADRSACEIQASFASSR